MPPRAPDLTTPLVGAGGEAVSFRATLGSHGLAWLPPNEITPGETSLTTTVLVPSGMAYALTITALPPPQPRLAVEIGGRRPPTAALRAIATSVRAMFALDLDLSGFYDAIAGDADLAFARDGYGRFLRSPTAFEDVVRTICTTNCSWSATERMITALVTHLGTPAAESASGWRGRAFPTASQLSAVDEPFYRDVVRAGYRGAYLRAIAAADVSGAVDFESWRAASPSDLPDDGLVRALLALPGVGPYAAAHAMMLFGRGSRLVLDSWTRPRYAQLAGRKAVADRTIERRFKRYGEHAGRAFWLYLWKSRHLGEDTRPITSSAS